MEKFNNEQLKEKYGDIICIKVPDLQNLEDIDGEPVTLEYIFRKPKSQHIERFLKEVNKKPAMAMKNLCFSLIIDEMKDNLEKDFETYPALYVGLSTGILDKMGMSDGTEIKKL